VDTCFALLVLARANVAKDLARNLRGRLKRTASYLALGGVGKEGFGESRQKTADEKSDKTKPSDPKLVDPSNKLGPRAVPVEEEDVEGRRRA